jgi:tetratricopeptide (TPR) repeat protein
MLYLARFEPRTIKLLTLRFVLLLLAAGGAANASAQLFNPTPCELVVRVRIGNIQNQASAGLTVQLLNGFGTIEQDQKTDAGGMVQFHTLTGIHSLRIYGPGIQEYTGRVELEKGEIRHTEMVQVQPEKTGASAATGPESATVPAARLKVPEKAKAEFESGSLALEKKEWAEAKKRFQAAIGIYPEYDVAYNGLGMAAASSGDAKAAREAFEKAVQLNDRFAEAFRNLARISLSERKYDEMDTLLTKSLESDPLNAWALTYAAYAELQTHKFTEAIANARKAHGLPHPGLASVHIVAARALEATQKPAEALAEYKSYLEEDPNGRDAARAREAVARLSLPQSN